MKNLTVRSGKMVTIFYACIKSFAYSILETYLSELQRDSEATSQFTFYWENMNSNTYKGFNTVWNQANIFETKRTIIMKLFKQVQWRITHLISYFSLLLYFFIQEFPELDLESLDFMDCWWIVGISCLLPRWDNWLDVAWI